MNIAISLGIAGTAAVVMAQESSAPQLEAPGVQRDSAAEVPAPAAPRVGPPDTSYYMKLGYIVAGVIFLAYIALLMRRVATVRKAP